MNTVVITGATSGIGLAAAKALAVEGWRVLLVGHSAEKGGTTLAAIDAVCHDAQAAYFSGDLMQQSEVHRVADELLAYIDTHCDGRLQALINNAGAARAWYTTTQEGYEQQFALNHLAGFLLTHRLLGALRKGLGRMLLTGSGSHKHCTVHWADVMYQRRRYNPLGAYKQSKLCNLLFAAEFNNRFAAEGLYAHVVDPGLVSTDIGFKGTGGIVSIVWRFRKRQGSPPERPAKTYAFLLQQPFSATGLYYFDCKPAAYDRHVRRSEDQKRLFALSEKLCGIAAFGGDEA